MTGLRYGLPVRAALAVARVGDGEPVVVYRGRELPVENAAAAGLGRPGGPAAGTVLVIDTPGGARAVRVDAVIGFVGDAEARRWPTLLAPLVGPGFPGLAVGGGGVLILVDAAALPGSRGPEGSGAREGARGTA